MKPSETWARPHRVALVTVSWIQIVCSLSRISRTPIRHMKLGQSQTFSSYSITFHVVSLEYKNRPDSEQIGSYKVREVRASVHRSIKEWGSKYWSNQGVIIAARAPHRLGWGAEGQRQSNHCRWLVGIYLPSSLCLLAEWCCWCITLIGRVKDYLYITFNKYKKKERK